MSLRVIHIGRCVCCSAYERAEAPLRVRLSCIYVFTIVCFFLFLSFCVFVGECVGEA